MTLPVAVVGGGVAGSATALALGSAGVECVVWERTAPTAGGGLGMILTPRGLSALDRLGVGDAVRRRGVVGRTAEKRGPSGTVLETRELPDHLCVFRQDLVDVLHDALPPGVVRWGRRVETIEEGPEAGGLRVGFTRGPAEPARGVVIADGRGSSLRELVAPAGSVRTTRVKELINVVRAPEVGARLAGRLVKLLGEEGGLSVGLSPTGDGRVFWYVQFDAGRFEPPDDDPGARRRFAEALVGGWAAPVPELLDDTDFRRSYLADVTTVEPPRRLSRGSAVLVGDAAHPLPTLLGEGGSTALEDAVLLREAVAGAKGPDSLVAAFAAFAARRHPDVRRLHRRGLEAVRAFLHPAPSGAAAR